MKLTTSIHPRKDGTVRATVAGETFIFKAGASSELECDVTDKAAIAALLDTGNFYPSNESDFEEAVAVIAHAKPVAPATARRGKTRAA